MMHPRTVRFLNPILALIGRKIVPRNMGHWMTTFSGDLRRTSIQIGWRLAKRKEVEGQSANVTELDRFIAQRKIPLHLKPAEPPTHSEWLGGRWDFTRGKK